MNGTQSTSTPAQKVPPLPTTLTEDIRETFHQLKEVSYRYRGTQNREQNLRWARNLTDSLLDRTAKMAVINSRAQELMKRGRELGGSTDLRHPVGELAQMYFVLANLLHAKYCERQEKYTHAKKYLESARRHLQHAEEVLRKHTRT